MPIKSTELLFIALFLRSLKIGGRCASIVPVGVVNNTNEKAYTIIRKELVENQRLRAIIYMPSGVFKPYSGVQTAILSLIKQKTAVPIRYGFTIWKPTDFLLTTRETR